MTTAVYRLPSAKRQDPSHSLLVCHLRSISPQEAITKLQASGVLAIPGPEANSIVLVGYHLEIRRLLSYYRTQELGLEDRYVNRTMGKLRKRLDSEVHSHAIIAT